jgi:ATP-dependent exoDNAse (exonuclease V) beta subunit
MVDEFQDSSAIQFELALLLADTDNLCVVGDWKQSIYGFQYADVENIRSFDDRLSTVAAALNRDAERVSWPTDDVTSLSLRRNYRSTGPILDLSTAALSVPATASEDPDPVAVDPLVPDTDRDDSVIEAIQHEDEHEAVLTKLQEIVENDDYLVEAEDGTLRDPDYGDIAVLTRTRDYGRELLATAERYGLPMAYEGGIELFHTDEAKLLLAWLRILEYDDDRGWAVVLERAGYLLDEIDAILDPDHDATPPAAMAAFRDDLAAMATLGGVARRVFERYGLAGPTADQVLTTVQSAREATTMTRGDLIRFVERGIEGDATAEVDTGTGTDAVTVQTIHATKGLEHPIVVLANMTQGRFPPTGGGRQTIRYDDPVGLRQRAVYDENAYDLPHVLDDWHSEVLRHCLPRGYDEERRLLYVAITRAERHLVFAAGETPNAFLEALPVDVATLEPDVTEVDDAATMQSTLAADILPTAGPTGHTPHTLMRTEPFEDVEGGRGTAYGTQVHEFAEAYARGRSVEPSDPDERHVAAFLDGLDGEVIVEEDATLPLEVDGDRVVVSGVVDLLHVTPERVAVVDYKTDRGRHGEAEYRTQLSVYAHVASAVYPEREVTASILYTATGERVSVDPLSLAELRATVRERAAAQVFSPNA